MTEAEYLACHDHSPMLTHLMWESRGRGVSVRKLRLFACACCRLMWDEFPHEGCRRAVRVAEDYADRIVSAAALSRAQQDMSKWPICDGKFDLLHPDEWALVPANQAVMVAYTAAGNLGESGIEGFARLTLGESSIVGFAWLTPGTAAAAQHTPGCLVKYRSSQGRSAETGQAIIGTVRDIFGNPFRPVTFLPEWRTPTAVALAQTMYESHDFTPAPILADALQDAGCDNDDILNHCRGPGPHVRGCWVVDLVLGKD